MIEPYAPRPRGLGTSITGISSFPVGLAAIAFVLVFQPGPADRLTVSASNRKPALNARQAEQTATVAPVGSWKSIPSPAAYTLASADFISADNGWAVSMGGEILRWDGKTWSQFPSPVYETGWLLSVKQLSATEAWIVGAAGTILHWDGSAWNLEPSPTDYDLYAVNFLSPTLGWAVGGQVQIEKRGPGTLDYYSVILKWDGRRWLKVPSPTRYTLKSLAMLNEKDGWAVGERNTILHWDGQRWREHTEPAFENDYLDFNSITMIEPNNGWIVGETISQWLAGETPNKGGIILHWDGTHWSEVQRTQLGLRSLSMVNANFGWAVGGKYDTRADGALILNWNGETWLEVPSPTKMTLEFVWAKNPEDGWIFAGANTLFANAEGNAILRYRIEPTATPAPSATALVAPSATETPVPIMVTPTSAPTLIPAKPSNNSSGFSTWFLIGTLLLLLAVGAFFFLNRRRKV